MCKSQISAGITDSDSTFPNLAWLGHGKDISYVKCKIDESNNIDAVITQVVIQGS